MTTTRQTPTIGQTITGRDVTMGDRITGTVVEVIPPVKFSGQYGPRFRLADTGRTWADGTPRTAIVEA